jgi:hypothetical protein
MSTCGQNAVGSSSKKEEEDLCSWLQRSFCSSYGALGFFAFHVAGGLFYSLIIPAVIAFILHPLSGRRSLA